MTENEIATAVVDAAFQIHTKLGPACSKAFTRRSWFTNSRDAACRSHTRFRSR